MALIALKATFPYRTTAEWIGPTPHAPETYWLPLSTNLSINKSSSLSINESINQSTKEPGCLISLPVSFLLFSICISNIFLHSYLLSFIPDHSIRTNPSPPACLTDKDTSVASPLLEGRKRTLFHQSQTKNQVWISNITLGSHLVSIWAISCSKVLI